MTPTLPGVVVVDPSVLRAALVDFSATRVSDNLVPGQAWSFAWTINRLATADWSSATISLDLVSESGELRPLWTRTQGWPLPSPTGLHPPPGAWPPYGAIVETPIFDAEGRALLYTGFGSRQLRVTLTPAGMGDVSFTTDIFRDISPEPHVNDWASLIVPSVGDWNASYPIALDVATDASASTSVTLEVVEQDMTGGSPTSYTGSLLRLPVGAGRALGRRPPDDTWTQSSVIHNWRWVVKPMYHADDALRQHQFSYSATLNWIDEFGNSYPAVALAPQTMLVRVSDQKWACAAAAELWFWFWVGVGIAGALIALSFGIASGVAAAGTAAGAAVLAAKLAVIAALGGLVGSAAGIAAPFQLGFWQEQADDPPSPDPHFWITEQTPPEVTSMLANAQAAVKDNDNVADGAAPEVARTTLLSYLGGLASRSYGRVLGANVAGSQAASKVQFGALMQAREQLTAVATQSAPQMLFVKPPTSDELAKNLSAALDQIAASKDVPAELLQAVSAARSDVLADCDRGAAILADDGYRQLVHDGAVTEMLTEIDGWLAPHAN